MREIGPTITPAGALENQVEFRFRFAERMVEQAACELHDGRTSSARTFIVGAMDQLDAAQSLIWEFEHGGGRGRVLQRGQKN
jgi:hypothetical protein